MTIIQLKWQCCHRGTKRKRMLTANEKVAKEVCGMTSSHNAKQEYCTTFSQFALVLEVPTGFILETASAVVNIHTLAYFPCRDVLCGKFKRKSSRNWKWHRLRHGRVTTLTRLTTKYSRKNHRNVYPMAKKRRPAICQSAIKRKSGTCIRVSITY